MEEEQERARRWLATRGVVEGADGSWSGRTPDGEAITSANDVAHEWVDQVWLDPGLSPPEQLGVALGLLDVLDEYWVTMQISWHVTRHPDLLGQLWRAHRERLEGHRRPEAVTYSLWVDWFEDPRTAPAAFAEVLGREVLAARRRGVQRFAAGPLRRRAERVLEVSGPVPWPVKAPVLRALSRVEPLHPALFAALLHGYHDLYGSLEPRKALRLLDRLVLPPDTEHAAPLRRVLSAGVENHYRDPGAWGRAT